MGNNMENVEKNLRGKSVNELIEMLKQGKFTTAEKNDILRNGVAGMTEAEHAALLAWYKGYKVQAEAEKRKAEHDQSVAYVRECNQRARAEQAEKKAALMAIELGRLKAEHENGIKMHNYTVEVLKKLGTERESFIDMLYKGYTLFGETYLKQLLNDCDTDIIPSDLLRVFALCKSSGRYSSIENTVRLSNDKFVETIIKFMLGKLGYGFITDKLYIYTEDMVEYAEEAWGDGYRNS